MAVHRRFFMSDGLDPEIAALLSQSGGSAPADDGPVEAEAFSFADCKSFFFIFFMF